MENNTNKYEKGYYYRSEYHCYTSFFHDLLRGRCTRYDTYEEAQELCWPKDLEAVYQIVYSDGNNNWYHCSDTGHDKKINENLVKKLTEGNNCLWEGYYAFGESDYDSLEDFFTIEINGSKHYYYSDVYESLEEVIEKKGLKVSEDGSYFYKESFWDGHQIKIIILYVDENKKVKEVKIENSIVLKLISNNKNANN